MGIDSAHYHSWNGRLGSPWRGCLAIVRVALLQVFRRRLYWFALGMGLLLFLTYFALIYAATQLDSMLSPGGVAASASPSGADRGRIDRRERFKAWLLERMNFHPQPGEGKKNGYLRFIEQQSYVAIILLAFAGSLLVGADFRLNTLPFYLSRRISRGQYIVGKMLGISAVICTLTVLPALVLFIEYGVFTSSFDYWLEYGWVALAILGYGAVLCLVLSLVVMAISAYLQRTAPIAITCFSLFILLGTLAKQLRDATGNPYWRLMDLWRDIRYVGRFCFDFYPDPDDRAMGFRAMAILGGVCLVSLAALYRRVRAVDVVGN